MTLPMCQWLSTERSEDHLVAWSENREWRQYEFRLDVLSLIASLSATSHSRWALCLEDNYSFAVALLALIYSGKTPVLPGHFRPAVLAEQQNEFDALITDLPLSPDCPVLRIPFAPQAMLTVLPEWPQDASVILFTSGSTGKPQRIVKSVSCLELESQWLCGLWGTEFTDARFAATVAPHHMYGLSFAFMLPLSLGLPFATASVKYHEQLRSLAAAYSLVFISSPAFLERLDPTLNTPKLRHVFSAGGPLKHAAARLVERTCGDLPTEIYGTTETGIIAFRRQYQPDGVWTLFGDIAFSPCPDGNTALVSPLVSPSGHFTLSDEIRMRPSDPRHFELLGRKDRIVKIAEQRVSLTEIEQRLCQRDLLSEASVLTVEKRGRVYVAAVLVLSRSGEQFLDSQGQAALLDNLRQTLRSWISPVALPRYWRIVAAIPLNQQGKRSAAELQEMFL
ncbi:acyl-CoA synthetase [Rahnella woolbedingensis]|uniref:Acyl-CoA synthetase n=1 Tax=Rahnella woolbedingensis TaxID=1510574 RepID=A0A419NCW0_9GAMM|nr:acyl-CoA synthetase [Rahnella woolbedingensis]